VSGDGQVEGDWVGREGREREDLERTEGLFL